MDEMYAQIYLLLNVYMANGRGLFIDTTAGSSRVKKYFFE